MRFGFLGSWAHIGTQNPESYQGDSIGGGDWDVVWLNVRPVLRASDGSDAVSYKPIVILIFKRNIIGRFGFPINFIFTCTSFYATGGD